MNKQLFLSVQGLLIKLKLDDTYMWRRSKAPTETYVIIL